MFKCYMPDNKLNNKLKINFLTKLLKMTMKMNVRLVNI